MDVFAMTFTEASGQIAQRERMSRAALGGGFDNRPPLRIET
jgi:hypothetical protein